MTLPDTLVFGANLAYGAKWILPLLEGALLVPLTFIWPHRHSQEGRWQRWTALALIALVNAANVGSLALLVQQLLYGTLKANGVQLIVAAVPIWLTNVLVFALWYWELDRGGPGARCAAHHREPDFLFPQMVTPEAAPQHWTPAFIDYLYVSFTNAMAFSPTDTMPLTGWAKSLMLAQSMASLLLIALVAARAVNILNG
jgi:uncharacterized membrane protein